jgi:trimeric autotransporter adhesin
MKRYIVLFLSLLAVSCGGGGDGGDNVGANPSGGGSPGGGGPVGSPVTGAIPSGPGVRVEESSAAVSRSGTWTSASSSLDWSGGGAVQSDVPGSTLSFTFTGSAVRWIGSRGRTMGRPLVRVDGGPAIPVELYANPYDEARTTVITLYDLTPGQHTLTIEVTARETGTNNLVVVDAFEVDPGNVISRLQDTDPRIMPTGRDANPGGKYTAGWARSEGGSGQPWSGNGVSNPPDLPVTAHETQGAGETVRLPFRGTGITWVGYRGPDAGIATVQIDGGTPVTVDLYSPTALYQAEAFTVSGLPDADHTITITSTGQRNAAATAARVVVDAFDVLTRGRRYEQRDPAITYTGTWHDNSARVWSGGASRTANLVGSAATFSFTGTSVSWIGCEKSSAGGTANVYIDGVLVQEVRLQESYPVEGYQKTVFRVDGLTPGPHTIRVEVISTNTSYVVVDAFDVHP